MCRDDRRRLYHASYTGQPGLSRRFTPTEMSVSSPLLFARSTVDDRLRTMDEGRAAQIELSAPLGFVARRVLLEFYKTSIPHVTAFVQREPYGSRNGKRGRGQIPGFGDAARRQGGIVGTSHAVILSPCEDSPFGYNATLLRSVEGVNDER
jgi:hypothetical protein